MKTMIPILSALILATAAFAGETTPKQAEIKKVVDQFNGKWKMEVTAAMPGESEKIKFPGTIDCQPISANSGVRCTMSGKSEKLGLHVEECLIANDPEGSGVHMMCVSNCGEVHDHKGKWGDDSKALSFEPFKATTDGKPSVEDVSFVWKDAKHFVARSVTTVGAEKVDMEFAAVKR